MELAQPSASQAQPQARIPSEDKCCLICQSASCLQVVETGSWQKKTVCNTHFPLDCLNWDPWSLFPAGNGAFLGSEGFAMDLRTALWQGPAYSIWRKPAVFSLATLFSRFTDKIWYILQPTYEARMCPEFQICEIWKNRLQISSFFPAIQSFYAL